MNQGNRQNKNKNKNGKECGHKLEVSWKGNGSDTKIQDQTEKLPLSNDALHWYPCFVICYCLKIKMICFVTIKRRKEMMI